MNFSNRFFAILENDKIIRLTNNKFTKLHHFDNNTSYPEFKNKKIKIATFLIQLKNRKPFCIIKEFYDYYEFNDKGKLNKEKYFEKLRLKLSTIDFGNEKNITEKNIINGTKIFYKRRIETQYQWKPSEVLKSKLHKQIFN